MGLLEVELRPTVIKMPDQHNQTITLPDHRKLGYAEYGDPKGKVVFFLHGQPGNRLFHPNTELTYQAGIRLVIPDRPGYGLSTYDSQRKLIDWPQDLHQLAQHLEADRYGVIGFSAGGPYALACGAAFPDNVSRLILISSAPPVTDRSLKAELSFLVRVNSWMLRISPKMFYLSFQLYWKQAHNNPNQFIRMAKAQSSAADRTLLEQEEIGAMLLQTWTENLRIDSQGYAKDAELLLLDWGIDLKKIDTEVQLWWGEQDKTTPTNIQEYFARKLPNSRIHLQGNAGHFGFLTAWDRICDLMQEPPRKNLV